MPKLCICTVQIPHVGIIFVHHGGVMPNSWTIDVAVSQLWVFGCFMLTVTLALGINFCCSTSIDVQLFYICSLFYYWENTIAQIMYLYCSDTTCRYHFCTPWRCNAKHLNNWYGCFYLNIMGIFKWLFFIFEVDEYFCTVTNVCRQCKCLNLDEYFYTVTGLFR